MLSQRSFVLHSKSAIDASWRDMTEEQKQKQREQVQRYQNNHKDQIAQVSFSSERGMPFLIAWQTHFFLYRTIVERKGRVFPP